MFPGLTLTHCPVLGGCQVSILGVQEAVPRLTHQFLLVVAQVVGDTGEVQGKGGLSAGSAPCQQGAAVARWEERAKQQGYSDANKGGKRLGQYLREPRTHRAAEGKHAAMAVV